MAGRKPWAPTDDQRKYVETMVAYGIPEDVIAGLMDVAPKTLRKHCKREIQLATGQFLAKTVGGLAAIAWGQRGNPARTRDGAIIRNEDKTVVYEVDWRAAASASQFIIARRGGDAWKETTDVNVNVGTDDVGAAAREQVDNALARLAAAHRPQETADEAESGAS